MFSAQKLREIFGFAKIKSAINKLEFEGSEVKISGQGFGHGAGLCQWGSKSQALLGEDYLQLLEHYYPKAKILREKPRIALVLNNSAARFPVSN